jgi:hypothetical protein
MRERAIAENEELPQDLARSVTPLTLTSFGLSHKRDRSGWIDPGILFGSSIDFNDLLLFWNLRASGASLCFCDIAQRSRLKPFVQEFLTVFCEDSTESPNRINLWSRAADWSPMQRSPDFDVTGLRFRHCQGTDEAIWNGQNIRPSKPQFTMWHRDVVPSYAENEEGAVASFALPDRPFQDDDPYVLRQHFVVSVEADEYGLAPDEITFTTPFIPRLNEFYGQNFAFEYDKARAEPRSLEQGAVGIICSIGSQRLEIRAIRVHEWIQAFFALFGVTVQRSEPGASNPTVGWGTRMSCAQGARCPSVDQSVWTRSEFYAQGSGKMHREDAFFRIRATLYSAS